MVEMKGLLTIHQAAIRGENHGYAQLGQGD